MKIFSMIQTKATNYFSAVNNYLATVLSSYKEGFGSNTIFGQLLNVLQGALENILSYVEDSTVEQNKYTATRKRSIYSLAEISGYTPSLGTATTATIKITYIPNNVSNTNVIIPNKTRILNATNGLVYNIILPQESIVCNIAVDNSSKCLSVVEGTFETQTFVASGGQLYSKNIKVNGDIDMNYIEVFVNDTLWTREESLYDMEPDSLTYLCKPAISGGIDLVFGNNENGRQLKNGDIIKVNYLLHSGEIGNISYDTGANFSFADKLKNSVGEDVDGNSIFYIDLLSNDSIVSGTFSDSTDKVREMIGMNSRSLVLADSKNYKKFFNKFSFIGYNRVWAEKGSLVVNALIMKNYKSFINEGSDYFNLHEQDFVLTEEQKNSIYNAISESGEQIAGSVFNIFNPEIVKYACYVYVKLKDGDYDTSYISGVIRDLIGNFFAEVQSDIFIPKSDIVHLIKTNVEEVDSVDIYFISELNEKALINGYYEKNIYTFDPVKNTHNITKQTFYIYDENPNVGFDSHGNILLDNNDQFPVLMGGWHMKNEQQNSISTINDPLTIIFE